MTCQYVLGHGRHCASDGVSMFGGKMRMLEISCAGDIPRRNETVLELYTIRTSHDPVHIGCERPCWRMAI